MYLPPAFANDDRTALLAHMRAHPFATLVTNGDDGPLASHVPLLIGDRGDRLRGHLARENPQQHHIAEGRTALAIFHGPHGYVSPSVYANPLSVPTWNYVVVQARGPATVVEDAELRRIVADTVARFDDTGWRLSDDPEFLDRMFGAIVGFEIAIQELRGKWKVSQNRPPTDMPNIIAWLARGDDESRALARLMQVRLEGGVEEPVP